ncbi:Myosin light chain kinase smooth muscle, partial [Fasciolopsis buskii]
LSTSVCHRITGGELFERIIDESFDLNESRCVRFMNEILQGVEYIHNQGVLHLDLKPENILCLSRTSFKIKIIDFGLARFYDGKEICVLFGTPEFVSPEVISYEPVCPAADMWSVGVICYVMLSGLSPFMGDSQGETMANILRVTYDFNYPEFAEISEDARNFIRRLLVKDPRKRMTASECLQHPWIKKKQHVKRKGTVSKKRLKHFVYRRKWQKAVNAIIALQRMGVVLHHPIPDKPNVQEFSQSVPLQETPREPEKKFAQSSSTVNNSPANASPKTRSRRKSLISMNRSIFNRLNNKRNAPSENAASEDGSSSPQTSSTPNSSRRQSILSKFGWNPDSGSGGSKSKSTITTSSISPKPSQSVVEEKKTKKKKNSTTKEPDLPPSTEKNANQRRLSIRLTSKTKPDTKAKIPASSESKEPVERKISKSQNPVDLSGKEKGNTTSSEATNKLPLKSVDMNEKSSVQQNENPQVNSLSPENDLTTDSVSSSNPVKVELKRTSLRPTPRRTTVRTPLPQGTSIAARIGFFSNLGNKPDKKA